MTAKALSQNAAEKLQQLGEEERKLCPKETEEQKLQLEDEANMFLATQQEEERQQQEENERKMRQVAELTRKLQADRDEKERQLKSVQLLLTQANAARYIHICIPLHCFPLMNGSFQLSLLCLDKW
jgi:leucyl aminopeptidase